MGCNSSKSAVAAAEPGASDATSAPAPGAPHRLASGVLEGEGASEAPWQVSTDQGWQPWDPKVPFNGEDGEVISYSLWSHKQPYEARFYAGGVGVQLNITSGIQRKLRRKDADPDVEVPATSGKVYGAVGTTGLAVPLAKPEAEEWAPVATETGKPRFASDGVSAEDVPPARASAAEGGSGKDQAKDPVARVVFSPQPREGTNESFLCCFCRPSPPTGTVEMVQDARPEGVAAASHAETMTEVSVKAPTNDTTLGGNLF